MIRILSGIALLCCFGLDLAMKRIPVWVIYPQLVAAVLFVITVVARENRGH